MALESVVFPQDLFTHNSKELCTVLGGPWSYDFGLLEEEQKQQLVVLECEEMGGGGGGGGGGGSSSTGCAEKKKGQEQGRGILDFEEWDVMNPSPETRAFPAGNKPATAVAGGRRKRRRTRSRKNREEVENQRMTHIAVERNRRKQMNNYLSILRSLMPDSYVQRGDQASIIGGAINFVKELEQLLQSLEAEKRIKQQQSADVGGGFSSPFADFFAFPQYTSSCSAAYCGGGGSAGDGAVGENRPGIADIEVNMVESHVGLKVLSRRRPKQLLKMVVGLQNLQLTTLHLNVTTAGDQMVLYSFSVKMEDDCGFKSVDEIATAVYQMLGRIQEEPGF